jgi:hypothetical protein
VTAFLAAIAAVLLGLFPPPSWPSLPSLVSLLAVLAVLSPERAGCLGLAGFTPVERRGP